MYGIIPRNQLPEQNAELVQTLLLRHLRAVEPHNKWAETGKLCQDFFEGRQWTEEQKLQMARDKRPIIVLNKIAPLIRLIAGYESNNRIDIDYIPTGQSSSGEDTADILQMIVKSIGNTNLLKHTDSAVFFDGIVTGRGFWDFRLDFENNDLGEVKITDSDPFSTFIDPDCDTYDLNKSAKFVNETRWASIDEIEFSYGKSIANLTRGLLMGGNSINGPYSSLVDDEVSPIRGFAQEAARYGMTSSDAYYTEFVDTYRKEVRLIDSQHVITEWCRHFIDLETGDTAPIPENWDEERIQKGLLYAKMKKQPMTVDWRKRRRIRWTVLCGDIMIFDNWSPYETYTKIPFFPYFRRGYTQGVVQDLLDPQREVNKRRMSITEILTRNASSGWSYRQDALEPQQKANLKRNGARPGFNLEWKGEVEPKKIEPGGYPIGHDKLEEKSVNDLREISGINESALGELDRVQSGRAIEARQRQSVIALQPYLDQFSRSKTQQGYKFLELIQNHYTEERVFRILGEDGKMAQFAINKEQQGMASGVTTILNDVTVGKYEVSITETPMSATFANAQFEEALNVLEKLGPIGGMLLQQSPDLLVEMSSLPQKEKWISALQQAVMAYQAQQQAAAQGAAAQGAGGQAAGDAAGQAVPPAVNPAPPAAAPQGGML